MLDGYEDLKNPGATLKQAFAMKESMVSILIELTGVKRSSIEFVPTDEIRGFIEYYLKTIKRKTVRKRLKAGSKQRTTATSSPKMKKSLYKGQPGFLKRAKQ